MWQRYEFFSKKAYLCSMNNEKKYLLGLTLAELKQVAKDFGMPAFTGGQMAKWLYEQHVKSIDEMTNISKANRAKLAAEYEIGCFGYSLMHNILWMVPSSTSSLPEAANLSRRFTSPTKTAPRCAFLRRWDAR